MKDKLRAFLESGGKDILTSIFLLMAPFIPWPLLFQIKGTNEEFASTGFGGKLLMLFTLYIMGIAIMLIIGLLASGIAYLASSLIAESKEFRKNYKNRLQEIQAEKNTSYISHKEEDILEVMKREHERIRGQL